MWLEALQSLGRASCWTRLRKGVCLWLEAARDLSDSPDCTEENENPANNISPSQLQPWKPTAETSSEKMLGEGWGRHGGDPPALVSLLCQKLLTLLVEVVVFFFFLGGGGLYLGGPLQHTRGNSGHESANLRFAHLHGTQRRPGCSQADTYSPLSLALRRLRYMATAVPIIASSNMAPIIPPMMLPVVGPFSGRRVPAEKE